MTETIQSITPTELHRRIESGEKVDVIDVRTPVEFNEIHASVARNVPLESLKPNEVMAARKGNSGQALYVICKSGSRGKQACEKFVAQGFENVVNILEGTIAWVEADLPVIRGKKAISLERQVRIAAGFFVLLGSLLGFFFHPYWIALSVVLGIGLMYAAITDTCGMAMVLAKMPWNQKNSS
jgi:rhodanese-related sulfurtransferase